MRAAATWSTTRWQRKLSPRSTSQARGIRLVFFLREETCRPSGSGTTTAEPAGWSSWVRPWAARSRADGGIWPSRGEHAAMPPLNPEHSRGLRLPGARPQGSRRSRTARGARSAECPPGRRLRQARRCPAGGRAVPASPRAPGDNPGARPGALRPLNTAFPRLACPRLSADPALRCAAPGGAARITVLPHVSEGRFGKVGIAASSHAGSRLSPGPARRGRCGTPRARGPGGPPPGHRPAPDSERPSYQSWGGRVCFPA